MIGQIPRLTGRGGGGGGEVEHTPTDLTQRRQGERRELTAGISQRDYVIQLSVN